MVHQTKAEGLEMSGQKINRERTIARRNREKSIARTIARRTADCDETSKKKKRRNDSEKGRLIATKLNGCVLSIESDEHDGEEAIVVGEERSKKVDGMADDFVERGVHWRSRLCVM
jgi:hypothetical protein